jgi:hypothetical protein
MMCAFAPRDSTPGTDDGDWHLAGLVQGVDAFGNDSGVAVAGGARGGTVFVRGWLERKPRSSQSGHPRVLML